MSSSPSRRSRTLLVGALLAAIVPAAWASPPHDDRTSDPLERAAIGSLSAVVRVETHVPITGVRDRGRVLPIRDDVVITGTGVAVAPRAIVTTDPVVHPSDRAVMDNLLARHVPGIDAVSAAARPVRGPLRVMVAGAELQTSAEAAPRSRPPVPVAPSAADDDAGELAVLRVPTPGPYLRVLDDQTRGSEVIAVGFGDRPDAVPAFRHVSFDVEARVTGRSDLAVVALDGEVSREDRGAPLIGRDGAVHGLVSSRGDGTTPALALRSSEILERVPSASGEADNPFATAMGLLWNGFYDRAATAFRQADTRAPSDLVRFEQRRAAALNTAPYRVVSPLERWRLPLIVVGLFALMVSALILRHLRQEDLRRRSSGRSAP